MDEEETRLFVAVSCGGGNEEDEDEPETGGRVEREVVDLLAFSMMEFMEASEGCLLSMLLDAKKEAGRGGDSGDESPDMVVSVNGGAALLFLLGDGMERSRASLEFDEEFKLLLLLSSGDEEERAELVVVMDSMLEKMVLLLLPVDVEEDGDDLEKTPLLLLLLLLLGVLDFCDSRDELMIADGMGALIVVVSSVDFLPMASDEEDAGGKGV